MVKKIDKKINPEKIVEVDPELEYLKKKSNQGAMNIVGDILDDPKVQSMIKKAILREGMSMAIIMSCILIGFTKAYDVAKLMLGFTWEVELFVSVCLILIGLIYVLKNMLNSVKIWQLLKNKLLQFLHLSEPPQHLDSQSSTST